MSEKKADEHVNTTPGSDDFEEEIGEEADDEESARVKVKKNKPDSGHDPPDEVFKKLTGATKSLDSRDVEDPDATGEAERKVEIAK